MGEATDGGARALPPPPPLRRFTCLVFAVVFSLICVQWNFTKNSMDWGLAPAHPQTPPCLPPSAMRPRSGYAATTMIMGEKIGGKIFGRKKFPDKQFFGPDRSQTQFHVQIDLNFTSRSTSISRSDECKFHVQIDLNFTSRSTSRSTSISRPGRVGEWSGP